LVVAYTSLTDVDDMPAAVAEAPRVLEPGALFAVCLTHPVADSGRFPEVDL
jgi:ubiquinone/menaquinone biosynthesis C-methylase UbiE